MLLSSAIATVLDRYTENTTPVIFGLGAEGYSSYQLLRSHLPELSLLITDDTPLAQLPEHWRHALDSDRYTRFLSPTEVVTLLLKSSVKPLIIKTPGIPFTHRLSQSLAERTISYTSNTELFFAILAELPSAERPITIGITGTKGKSTTTALIHHVLEAAKPQVLLAGNIGVPPLDLVTQLSQFAPSTLPDSIVVLELSSHQLQNLPYSPHIAVVQDITPEHLDYYRDFDEYWQAKAAITAHQTDKDYVIFCPDFTIPQKIADQSPATQLTHSLQPSSTTTAYLENGILRVHAQDILNVDELPLVGGHNILNTFPALIIADLFALPIETIRTALQTFTPLPHRLEFVAEVRGVRYYNDSQATTPEASLAAIKSFPGKQIVLLAGGSDKGVSFNAYARELLTLEIHDLFLFPPTGAQIATILQSSLKEGQQLPQMQHVHSMQEAVQQAAAVARPGGIVLLSPACASFGLFKNYKDRGEQFIAAVRAL